MAENRASGPQLGQMVIFTQTQTIFYPAIIVSIDRVTGLARLTTFPAGGTTPDQQNVSYDGTGARPRPDLPCRSVLTRK
jgi:hypothetical protein